LPQTTGVVRIKDLHNESTVLARLGDALRDQNTSH
jgi:hypothetical protein